MCCHDDEVLDLPAEAIEAIAHYRHLLSERGPDRGGDGVEFSRWSGFPLIAEIIAAWRTDFASAVRVAVARSLPVGVVLVQGDPRDGASVTVGAPGSRPTSSRSGTTTTGPFFHAHEVTLDVPAGNLTVRCGRGLEFDTVEQTVTANADTTTAVTIDPPRRLDPTATGWYGGELHVHLNYSGDMVTEPADAARMQRGEGLHLMNLVAGNFRTGRTMVTNGPWLTLEVDGHGPGSVLDLPTGSRLPVVARIDGPGVEHLTIAAVADLEQLVVRVAVATGSWICFEDEAGQTLRPPKARTWALRGHTPVVAVSGKGSGRVSVAGLVCLRTATRGRLFYRVRVHHGRKGERRSLPPVGRWRPRSRPTSTNGVMPAASTG